jgi:hypothetical protein
MHSYSTVIHYSSTALRYRRKPYPGISSRAFEDKAFVQEMCKYALHKLHKICTNPPAHLSTDPNRYFAPISQSLPLINRLPPPPRSSRALPYCTTFVFIFQDPAVHFCPAFKSSSARAFPRNLLFLIPIPFFGDVKQLLRPNHFQYPSLHTQSSFPYTLPNHTVLRGDQPCKPLPTMAPKNDLEAAPGFDVEKQTGTQSSGYSSDIEPAETQDEAYDSDCGNPDPDHNEVASMDRGHMADLLTMKSHVSTIHLSTLLLNTNMQRPLGKPVENQSRMKPSNAYPQVEQPEAGSRE